MTINNIENLESGASVRGKLNDVISEVNNLGTAANADVGDFATSAQGALADTAVQPGDLGVVATTNDYTDLDNLPSLGTISSQNSNNITITGGNIDGTTIGATTASTGAFTTLSASTSLTTPLITRAGTLALSTTSANAITASTNGVERMRIASNGSVGIGTNSPQNNLDVFGNTGIASIDANQQFARMRMFSSVARIESTFFSGAGGAYRPLAFATGDTERLRITSAGNVGIGTTSPDAALQVVTSGPKGATFTRTMTSLPNDAFALRVDSTAHVSNMTLSGALAVDVNSGRALVVNGLGNVGIGTGLPVNNTGFGGLTLNGTTGSIFSVMANGTETGRLGAVSGETFLQSMGSGTLKFIRGAGGTESMRIDSAGNVGIGTTSPATRFHVNQATDNNGITLAYSGRGSSRVEWELAGPVNEGTSFFHNNGTNRFRMQTMSRNNIEFLTNNTERMRIDSAGNVLVGITSGQVGIPADPVGISLYGNGSGNSHGAGIFVRDSVNAVLFVNNKTSGGPLVQFINGGNTVGSITSNGTTTAYNTSSDYRLKENVTPLSDATDRLMQIPVHRFNFIADPDTVVDGFLAHEVQPYVPEAVTGEKDAVDKDGNPVYQGIDQSKLVPLLTAALQDALKRIEALEAQLNP